MEYSVEKIKHVDNNIIRDKLLVILCEFFGIKREEKKRTESLTFPLSHKCIFHFC